MAGIAIGAIVFVADVVFALFATGKLGNKNKGGERKVRISQSQEYTAASAGQANQGRSGTGV